MELCSLQLYFYIFHLQVKSEIYLPTWQVDFNFSFLPCSFR